MSWLVPGLSLLLRNEGTTASGLGCLGIVWVLGPWEGSLLICVYSSVLPCLLPGEEVRNRSALLT